MNLPEENIKSRNKGKISNIIVSILLILIIIVISSLVYLKSQNIDFKSTDIQGIIKNTFQLKNQSAPKPKVTVVQCDEKEKYAFAVYKDMLIKCTSDNIKAIDKDGNEQWSIPIAMSNPKIKLSNADFMVYDLGGRDIVVVNGKSEKWSKKLDNNIINADISESGHVSVVQELKGYKAAVTVFNLQGGEFFTRSYADNFIFKAMVSPSGKYVAIESIDVSGAQATTNIELTDMLGKPFAAKAPKQGEMFPSLWFIREEILAAVNEASVVCFDKSSKDQKEKWKLENKERVIYSSAASGRSLFVAMSGDEKAGLASGAVTELKVFNAEGKQAAQYTLHDKVISMDAYSDVAALNTGRQVYFINSQGKLIGKYTSKIDVSEVHFFNKSEIAAVTKNAVLITKIEQEK